MEVRHCQPGKAAKLRSIKIKGMCKRNERLIKDDFLLEKLGCQIKSGGAGDAFYFE